MDHPLEFLSCSARAPGRCPGSQLVLNSGSQLSLVENCSQGQWFLAVLACLSALRPCLCPQQKTLPREAAGARGSHGCVQDDACQGRAPAAMLQPCPELTNPRSPRSHSPHLPTSCELLTWQLRGLDDSTDALLLGA